VDYLSWGDPYQNYSDDEIVNTGYWTFENKYGGSINYIETDYFERFNDLANLTLGGTPPDLFPGGSGSTACFPMRAIKGVTQAIDDYIDYDDPLWSPVKDVADHFMLGGKHYQIVIYTAPYSVCLYNKRIMSEYGYDDPAELYYNDEWTWDEFYEMCIDFSDPDEDRFALDGYWYADGIVDSTGQQIMQIDEDGKYYSNVDSPEIERAWNLVYELCKNDCNYRDATGNRWALRNPSGLKDGKLLFFIEAQNFFTSPVEEIENNYGAISDGELMFAPLPRDPNGDGNYYLLSDFDDINGALCIINNAENPEGAALLASCIRFKHIDPVVRDIDKRQLKEVYLWSDDMLEMKEECQRIADGHYMFSLAGDLNQSLNDVLGFANAIPRSASPQTWASLKESNRERLAYYIDELNSMIDEYNQENS
jgi:ABC-type glycerol-3-phosphate transport system substrate-binding protein